MLHDVRDLVRGCGSSDIFQINMLMDTGGGNDTDCVCVFAASAGQKIFECRNRKYLQTSCYAPSGRKFYKYSENYYYRIIGGGLECNYRGHPSSVLSDCC